MEGDLEELRQIEAEHRRVPEAIDMHVKRATAAMLVLGADWVNEAACATSPLDPDDWFPETASDRKAAALAKAVCWDECPVRLECLKAACLRGERHGIYGGFTKSERLDHKHNYEVLSLIGSK